jgi:hypothetical protein
MRIPTEPIESIPKPVELIERIALVSAILKIAWGGAKRAEL